MSYGNVAFDKAEAMRLLRMRNVVRATVRYSGGNDSGGVDSIELEMKDGSTVNLDQHSTYDWQTRQTRPLTHAQQRDNQLHEMLSALVYDEWGSFAGDFYVDGTFTFDVEANKVRKEQSVETPRSDYEEDEW